MQLSSDAVQCPVTALAASDIDKCRYAISQNHGCMYDLTLTHDAELIYALIDEVLPIIAQTNAPYHNLAHTISVISAGQQILEGKHRREGNVSRQDWLNVTAALVCHDVGYIRGACYGDDLSRNCYRTGEADGAVCLGPYATDASLTPYHVSRGLLFVEQRFGNSISIDADAVKTAIDFTRFPVPAEPAYQDIQSYPGLVRAADLIGQLADPAYLLKLPHLLEEMRETGTAQALGYHHPKDMLDGYLDFYRRSVYPYIQPALGYLNETPEGQDTIRRLYNNLAQSERDEVPSVGRFRQITIDELGRIS